LYARKHRRSAGLTLSSAYTPRRFGLPPLRVCFPFSIPRLTQRLVGKMQWLPCFGFATAQSGGTDKSLPF